MANDDFPGGGLRLENPPVLLYWRMPRSQVRALLARFRAPPPSATDVELRAAAALAIGSAPTSTSPAGRTSDADCFEAVTTLGGVRVDLKLDFDAKDLLHFIAVTSFNLSGTQPDYSMLAEFLGRRLGEPGAPSDFSEHGAIHWRQPGAEVWLINTVSESFDISFPMLVLAPPGSGDDSHAGEGV